MLVTPTSMKQPLGGQTGTWEGGKMLRRTFCSKNRYGVLMEVPHKVLDSKSRWRESFTRGFFQASRSQGSGPACLSAPSLVSNVSSTQTSTTPPSSHQETSLPTAQKIEVFRPELPPLPATEQGLQALSPCAGGGGLLRGPHPLAGVTSAPGQAL